MKCRWMETVCVEWSPIAHVKIGGIMDDYGHVDDETPSLAIALYKEFRGSGIGTALMNAMLALLKTQGYKTVSLSVQKANHAYKLYLKLGFRVIEENDEEYIMVCNL